MGEKQSIATPEEKLSSLGVTNKDISATLTVLKEASTPNDLVRGIVSRKWTCDEEQFLLPMFRPLYLRDPDVKQAVLNDLSSSGIPTDVINIYFTDLGNQPYLPFHLGHQEIDVGKRKVFIEEAKRTMLSTMRAYLGLEDNAVSTS